MAFQAIVEKLFVQALVSVDRVVIVEADLRFRTARVDEREVGLVLRETVRVGRRKADVVSVCRHVYSERVIANKAG